MTSYNANLLQLGYTSKASVEFGNKKLVELLEGARRKNTELNITGMLLFKGDTFLQILEGEREDVESLFEMIKSDQRHEKVIKIFEHKPGFREFEEWSMGFHNLDDTSAELPEGYTDFLNDSEVLASLNKRPKIAHRLLLHFRGLES